MIIALIAMGIVLVYRSSRVINFAVGDLGVPATALLAIMVGIHHWPYWLALPAAVAVGALSGHRRRAGGDPPACSTPRVVIVLVATIGVAELAQAVVRCPPRTTGPGRSSAHVPPPHPRPVAHRQSVTVSGAQVLALIAVPVIDARACGGCSSTPRFGESVRASVCQLRTWPV